MAGLIAATLLTVTGVQERNRVGAATASGNCTAQDSTLTINGRGGHPSKDFYEPAEPAPADDFGHVLVDRYLVVYYHPSLPAGELSALRGYVTGPDGNRVFAGPDLGMTGKIRAVRSRKTLYCDSFDLPALKNFVAAWEKDPRSRPID